MYQEKLTIQNPSGLHARPASVLTQACQKFKSDIAILVGEKSINPKSIVSLLAAGVKTGTEITLTANGEDEAEAGTKISELIRSFAE